MEVGVSVEGVRLLTIHTSRTKYGGATSNLKMCDSIAAGDHTVEITALFDKNAASSEYSSI